MMRICITNQFIQRAFGVCFVTLLLLSAGSLGTVAVAEEAGEVAFNINNKKLAQALKEFADQADFQVMFSTSELDSGKRVSISGKYKPLDALSILLVNTGFEFVYDGEKSVAIRPIYAVTNEISGEPSLIHAEFSSTVDSSERLSAQDDSKSERLPRYINEVIVTATKREMNLRDIPISIDVFGSDRLEKSGFSDLRDAQFLSAGLHITDSFGQTRITVRGIGSDQFTVGAESGVAVHRDGIYLSQRFDQAMPVFDVDRIEVVKGPQGTLYGRNATGGAVNIISNKPKNEFEAAVGATLGNYDFIETEGYFSGPLINDKLLARVAFKTRDRDGFTSNWYNGDTFDNEDFSGLRGTLRYEPTDSFRLDIIGDYLNDDSVSVPIYGRGRAGDPLSFETLGGILPRGRSVNYNNEWRNQRDTWGLGADAEWDIGWAVLKSLVAYREYDGLMAQDLDAGDASLLFIDKWERNADQTSGELTLTSSMDGSLEWVIGAYYMRSNEFSLQTIPIPSFDVTILGEIPSLKSEAYAIFGEISYHIMDDLTLTFGARYSYEEKSIEQFSGSLASPRISNEILNDNWDSFSPKVSLSYEISDFVTAYATVGKGFKAGGYNGGTFQGRAYDPEYVTNYEIGLKSILFDNQVHANLSFFHMDYEDLQVQVNRFNPLTGTVGLVTDNAAASTIRGAEVDVQAQMTDRFSFDANASYLDAKFDQWADAILNGVETDVSGNRMSFTPEWSANIGMDYTVPISEWGAVTLRGEYSYKGRVYFTAFEDRFNSESGFELINIRLTFDDKDERWSISSWVKNLADEEVASFRGESGNTLTGRPSFVAYFPPRTYGVTVKYNF